MRLPIRSLAFSLAPLLVCFAAAVANAQLAASSEGEPASTTDAPLATAAAPWRSILTDRLASFGHRNWIAVVDSAYPEQTSPGVETVVTHTGHLKVLTVVLNQTLRARHVTPRVYLDAELDHVPAADAPGVEGYRAALENLFASLRRRPLAAQQQGDSPQDASYRPAITPNRLPHDELIRKLDAAGEHFKVLVLKTNLTVPYSSVFIELDCAYWTPEAEKRLRERMSATPE